ncbi:hypothetical protein [Streptomyces globosus]|uniref:hypothetical protein n=1 Tax=Streptomyces globosus TaxID=68209 RepID=UPI0031DBB07A
MLWRGRSGEDQWDVLLDAGRLASLQWPAAPEAGFHGEAKHAEVTLFFNTRTRELGRPSGDTVLVHVRSVVCDGRQTGEPYARRLAAQVGLAVVGPAQRS